MKLNDNGDFCLLYVEPADEKQSLFETIGAQIRPVVLMLLLEPGQSRPRLFQRPEDFSDLKHVRRQSGVSVIFLTAGSERLAHMAARYGFPAYPSIDAFADFLAYGHRPEGEERAHHYAQRRARTGPLLPLSAQSAAQRHALPTGPLRASSPLPVWPSPEVESAMPLVEATATAPLHEQQEIAFWPPPESSLLAPSQLAHGHVPSPPAESNGYHTPVPPANEALGEAAPYLGEIPPHRSASLPNEQAYTLHPGWEPEEGLFNHSSPVLPEYAPPARPSIARSAPNFPAQSQRTYSAPNFPAQPQRTSAAARSVPDQPTQPQRAGAAVRSLPDLPTRPQRARAATHSAPTLLEPPAPMQTPEPKRRSLAPVLILLSLLILGGAGLGSFIVISHVTPAMSAVARPVGSMTFVSSEQLNATTSQGIDDEVQITLHNMAAPAAGKSYYAWLLGDPNQAESQSILLGKLPVVNGSVNLLYPGDAQHTNLLLIGSRFLITEEDSTTTPLLPSPDTNVWRYYGALPAVPDPNDKHHFAFVNHLRHLLADEPILDEMELPGGLNNWFTRNTQKLVEWTSNVRDQWQASSTHNTALVRTEAQSILSYLDGMSFLQLDLPPASARLPVTLDTHLAALGLLNVRGPSQNPPSYMDQIVYHLNGLLNAPGSPANVRSIATSLLPAMSNVTTWLQNLRNDDKQLLAMTDAQLGQPAAFSLLNDMVLQAGNAYTGNTDPSTGQLKQGVSWIHEQLQSIATISVSTYITGSAVPEIGPSSRSAPTSTFMSALRRPL